MDDDLTLPSFLKISAEARKAAWEGVKLTVNNFVDPKLAHSDELRKKEKEIKTQAFIKRIKNRPPKEIITRDMTWNINTSKWENQKEIQVSKELVAQYNALAASLGKPLLTIKKFESRAIGEKRIQKLQSEGSEPSVVATDVEEPPVQKEDEDVAKKKVAKKKSKKAVAAAGSNGSKKGAKTEAVLALLTRKSGTTVEEAKELTGWEQVHLSAFAKKAGLKLRKERNKEGVTRYWAD
jgi:hypothetical protein